MSSSTRENAKLQTAFFVAALLAAPAPTGASPVDAPTAFDVANHHVILSVHAEGAQIDECKATSSSQTAWTFREPVATLIADGKTVGHHGLGPNWDFTDGSGVKGKLSASAPGVTPRDIALLKLDVMEHRGEGVLNEASIVLRLNTHGGGLEGPCDKAGAFRAEPYSADYLFLR